jgi:hypothetical protein
MRCGLFVFTVVSTASARFAAARAALSAGRSLLPRYRRAALRRAGLLWRNASNSRSNRLRLCATRGPSSRSRNVARATFVLIGTSDPSSRRTPSSRSFMTVFHREIVITRFCRTPHRSAPPRHSTFRSGSSNEPRRDPDRQSSAPAAARPPSMPRSWRRSSQSPSNREKS